MLLRRTALALAACCAVAGGVVAAEQAVALPPFMVEEQFKGPPWRYASLPGYEVLSRCDDDSTQDVVGTHVRLQVLLSEMVPERLRARYTYPRQMLLFPEELQSAASQEVIAKMMRESPGGSQRFSRNSFGAPVAYSFMPNLQLWDRDGMATFSILRRGGLDLEHLQFTPDHVARLLRNRAPALPRWFVVGFLDLYENVKVTSDTIGFPDFEWKAPDFFSLPVPTPELPEPAPLLPLAQFFIAQPPAGASESEVAAWQRRWTKQAALFVRWGLDGEKAPRREALWRLVERVAAGGSSSRLFPECFGLELAEADVLLATYFKHARRNEVRFRVRDFTEPKLTLRKATDVEIARMKGDWERLEVPYVNRIMPEMASKYLEQARRTFERAYERNERAPDFLAAYGLCELDAGNLARARELLEAGAARGQMRPRAWCELARLRLAEIDRAQPLERVISVRSAITVLEPLFAARAAEPPQVEVYQLLGEVWSRISTQAKREHLIVLDEGIRYFPRQAELVYRAAEANLRHGFADTAAAYIDLGKRVTTEPALLERFNALATKLPQEGKD